MKKRTNHTKSANLTLGGISLGFILSYPFHASFIGGLISSGCSAGMIGGLADWFAVTALFRRPLGIRPSKLLRTEIIPQNRERIFAALADMVQHELLSQEVLKGKLAVWDFSGVLIRVFSEPEVRDTVSLLLTSLGEEITSHKEAGGLQQWSQDWLQGNIERLSLSEPLAEIVRFSVERGDVDKLLQGVCQVINEWVDQPLVSHALTNMMGNALKRYGEKNPSRKLVEMFLPSPAILAQGALEKAKTALQDGSLQQWLKNSLLNLMQDLKTNLTLQQKVNHFILDTLDSGFEQIELKEKIATFLSASSESSEGLSSGLITLLDDHWEGLLKRIENNSALRIRVDQAVKGILEKQIRDHHDAIGNMVRGGLDQLTNDMLVKLIEEKAGNDLQIIRINGSVVGALAGMIIYLIGVVLK